MEEVDLERTEKEKMPVERADASFVTEEVTRLETAKKTQTEEGQDQEAMTLEGEADTHQEGHLREIEEAMIAAVIEEETEAEVVELEDMADAPHPMIAEDLLTTAEAEIETVTEAELTLIEEEVAETEIAETIGLTAGLPTTGKDQSHQETAEEDMIVAERVADQSLQPTEVIVEAIQTAQLVQEEVETKENKTQRPMISSGTNNTMKRSNKWKRRNFPSNNKMVLLKTVKKLKPMR